LRQADELCSIHWLKTYGQRNDKKTYATDSQWKANLCRSEIFPCVVHKWEDVTLSVVLGF
jgi:hypothetical protein